MAIYEQDVVMFETKENGDKVVKMPISRANNIEGIGRSISTAYAVDDVVYVDNNKKVALKCTQAGTTSNSELNVSTASIGNVITDGSVVWQVCNRTSDVTSVNGKTGDVVVDLPVGHMYWSVEPNVPAGRLPALGATYNRSLYADLWAWANERGFVKSESEWQAIASANDGNCDYYSSGDGSTTFRVPKMPTTIVSDVSTGNLAVKGNGMTVGFTDGSQNYGLKNDSEDFLSVATGYYGQPISTSKTTGSYYSNNYGVGITTDGSKSGMVAEAPKTTKITGQWFIVAFGVAHNIGEADVANVMQAVETAQTSVRTVDNKITGISDYIVESYRNGTEWYEVYKSGKVRQGGKTANGTGTNVTLLKPYANTNYLLTVGGGNHSGNWPYGNVASATQVFVGVRGTGGSSNLGCYWVAEGQGA